MRTRSTVVGYALLTVLLTAGAAQGLSGSNTVFSDDIVDGAIITPDLKTGAVSGSKILDNSVTGSDINEATIPGFKRLFFARVNSGGALNAGDATQAVRDGLGEYRVTFKSSTSTCAATAGGAAFPASSGSFLNDVRATTQVGNGTDGTVVRVSVRTGSGAAADSHFALVLVCP